MSSRPQETGTMSALVPTASSEPAQGLAHQQRLVEFMDAGSRWPRKRHRDGRAGRVENCPAPTCSSASSGNRPGPRQCGNMYELLLGVQPCYGTGSKFLPSRSTEWDSRGGQRRRSLRCTEVSVPQMEAQSRVRRLSGWAGAKAGCIGDGRVGGEVRMGL